MSQKVQFRRYLTIGTLALMSGYMIFTTKIASASDIPVEIYVAGQLTMALYGAWNTGIVFPTAPIMNIDLNLGWPDDANADYIAYADDTTTAGFYITMSMTNFIYAGQSPTQGDLPAGNFKLIGKYINEQASTSTIGSDDPTKTVSISADSCTNATPSTYALNSDLTNGATNYSLQGSNTSKIVVQSNANCKNIGILRFDRATLILPQYSEIGAYTSTMTITMIDGTP